MRTIDQLLSKYGESHQNKTNKLIHWIMVPAIFFSIVGLLMSIPFPMKKTVLFNWATPAMVAALAYYLNLSKPLFLGFIAWALFCLYVNFTISQQTNLFTFSLIVFAVAWVFQFIGHKIEGVKPSFLDDIKFLLIGPAWLMHFIYKKLGIKY